MRRVAAIVTDKGGRTAHAAIVSREFGLPCIVGTGARDDLSAYRRRGHRLLRRGRRRACLRGRSSRSTWSGSTRQPCRSTRTKVMLIVGDPSRAFSLAAIPNAGVGLARDRVHRHESRRHPSDGAGALSAAAGSTGGHRDRRENRGGGCEGVLRSALQRGGRADCGGVLSQAGHRPHQRLQDERVRRAARRAASSSRPKRTR